MNLGVDRLTDVRHTVKGQKTLVFLKGPRYKCICRVIEKLKIALQTESFQNGEEAGANEQLRFLEASQRLWCNCIYDL